MNGNESIASEITENDDDVRVFRVHKDKRDSSIGFLIFFTLLISGYALLVWFKALPDRRVNGLIFSSLLWSFLGILPIWLILAYHFKSLTIGNGKVIQRGILFRKEMDLYSVRQAHWNSMSCGITLTNLTEKNSISFALFEPEEQLWLIQYFLDHIPESIQQNWDLFCFRVAIPLRDPKPAPEPDPNREPGPGEILITRKRYDRIVIPLIFFSITCGVLPAWYFQNVRLLFLSAFPIGFWLLLRYSTPKQGKVDRRISSDQERKQLLILSGWSYCLGFFFLTIFKMTHFPEPQNTIAGVCLFLIWIVVLLVKATQAYRACKQSDLEKSKAAVQQWEDGPESTQNMGT